MSETKKIKFRTSAMVNQNKKSEEDYHYHPVVKRHNRSTLRDHLNMDTPKSKESQK